MHRNPITGKELGHKEKVDILENSSSAATGWKPVLRGKRELARRAICAFAFFGCRFAFFPRFGEHAAAVGFLRGGFWSSKIALFPAGRNCLPTMNHHSIIYTYVHYTARDGTIARKFLGGIMSRLNWRNRSHIESASKA